MKPPGPMRSLCLALALLLPACECARVDPVTGKTGLSLVSDDQEISLGAEAAPSMEQESGGVYPDRELAAYVDGIGQRLALASHRPEIPHRYTVLNTDVPNAFALPGGFIYITRGLLVRLSSESELAAVLGHETAHVSARHGVKHLQLAMGLNLVFEIAGRAAAASGPEGAASRQAGLQVAQLVAALGSLKYSRDDERQADELGLQYAEKAGWDPRGMIGLHRVLHSLEQREPTAVEGLLRTHPLTNERIQNAESTLAARDPAQLDRLTRTTPEFERHLARLKQSQIAYGNHEKARELAGQGKLKQSLASSDEAIRQDPAQGAFWATRALTRLRMGDAKAAREDARRAVQLAPELFDAQYALGLSCLELGEGPEARGALAKAAALWPDHPGPPLGLGQLCERAGKRDEALLHYRLAASLDPGGETGRRAEAALRRLTAP